MLKLKRNVKRMLAIALAISLTVALAMPLSGITAEASGNTVQAGGKKLGDYIKNPSASYVSKIPTPQDSNIINPNYDRSHDNYEVTSDAGFLHPGIFHTREELNIMRDMVWIGAEPWASAFELFQQDMFSSLDYRSDGPFKTVEGDRETYALVRDARAAYQLALMWYITGKDEYLEKTKKLLNDWSGTLEKDNKADHIRNGQFVPKFAAAAEILKYTPSSGWGQDTEEGREELKKFTDFLELFNYSLDRKFQYFNQGLFATIGYMAKAIFKDDAKEYAEAVERTVYNVGGGWQKGNSVNFSLATNILDSGQIVEMGRDQPHAMADIGLYGYLAQMVYVQGTKVDGYGNIVSTGGTDLYEYGSQKILKALSYILYYNMGYDVEFEPNVNGLGQKTEWSAVSVVDRGVLDPTYASIYNHYRYIKGYESGDRRSDGTTYGDYYSIIEEVLDLGLEGGHGDFPGWGRLASTPLTGGDYDMELKGSPSKINKLEDNFKKYDRYHAADLDGTGNGSATVTGQNGGAIREPVVDEEGFDQWLTSDVNNGEWVAYTIDFDEIFGTDADNPTKTIAYTYGMNSSTGGDITLYVGDVVENPTVGSLGEAELVEKFKIPNTGWYYTYNTAYYTFTSENANKLQGEKTIYFYFDNSSNGYNFHASTLWFKFMEYSSRSTIDGADADVVKNAEVNGQGKMAISNGGYIGFKNVDFDNGISEITFSKEPGNGKLKLYTEDPSDENNLVKSYDFSGSQTESKIKYDHTGDEQIYGLQDIYFVYEGSGDLVLNSFTGKAPESSLTFTRNPGGSYTSVIQGTAEAANGKSGSVRLSTAGKGTKVTYRDVNFLTGADTLAIRVKSDTDAVLALELLTGATVSSGAGTSAGVLASFNIKNTTNQSEDGWITLLYDLTKSGYNTLTGSNFISLTAQGGNGTVELEYFVCNPPENEPWLSVKDGSTDQDVSERIQVIKGNTVSWNVTAGHQDDKAVTVIADSLPLAGAEFNNGVFGFNTSDVSSGSYPISFIASDGNTAIYRTITIKVIEENEYIEELISKSGINDHLMSLYLYDQSRYRSLMNAKNAADITNRDTVQALEEAISDCMDNLPVFTKIRFNLITSGDMDEGGDTLTVMLGGAGNPGIDGNVIVRTGNLKTSNHGALTSYNYETTAWYPFTKDGDPNGESIRVDGSYDTIKIVPGMPAVDMTYFELANEDESYVMRVYGIANTSRQGNHTAIREQTPGNNIIPALRFGSNNSQWARWTNAEFDFDIEAGYKTSGNKDWPCKIAGGGYDFVITPNITTALIKADTYLKEASRYTTGSIDALRSAYDTATNLSQNYVSEELTYTQADEAAAAIQMAIKGLKKVDTIVTILEDGDNKNITSDFMDTTSDNTSPNRSSNPSFTTTAGNEISFLINTGGLEEPEIVIEQLGYRGHPGSSAVELREIEPAIDNHGAELEKIEGETGLYKFSYTNAEPGNYRVNLKISDGDTVIWKTVEMVYRNDLKAKVPNQYARIRYSGFRVGASVTLVATDSNNISTDIATFETPRTGGRYVLADWVEVAGFTAGGDYTLSMKFSGANDVSVDFIELATESYSNVYPDSYQGYPLSTSGVKRIEAEHFDWRTGVRANTAYGIDFAEKFGWESGGPGLPSGNISNTEAGYEYKYNNVYLVATEEPDGETMVSEKIMPNADGYVHSGSADTNYFTNGPTLTISSPSSSSTTIRTAFVRFDLEDIPEEVDEAVLYLRKSNTNRNTLEVSTTSNEWDPGTLTYNTLPDALNAYTVLLKQYVSDSVDVKLNVTEAVNAAKNNGNDQITFRLSTLNLDADGETEWIQGLDFRSSRYTDNTAYQPGLVITYKDTIEPEEIIPVSKISLGLENDELSLLKGNTFQLVPVVTPDGATYPNVSYATSNPGVATVNRDGVITATGIGTTVITVLTADTSVSCNVYVGGRTYLRDLITAFNKYLKDDEEKYTESTWATLQEKLAQAESLAFDDNARAKVLYEGYQDLKEAIDSLVKASNLTALNVYLDLYHSLSEEDYSEATWEVLVAAVEGADGITKQTSQSQVNQAVQNLQNALLGLDYIGVEPEPNKDELQSLYDENKDRTQGGYTDEIWRNFTEALELALTVLENENSTQVEIDTAYQLFLARIDELRANESRMRLQMLYDEHKEKEQGSYTEATWNAFTDALTGAEGLLEDSEAEEIDILKAIISLNEAVQNLKLKEVPVPEVSKSNLQTLFNNYKDIKQGNYTDASWTAFSSALQGADRVLKNSAASQAEVDNAQKVLSDAYKNLALKPTVIFNAVTNITGVPSSATAGTRLTLTGTVVPSNSTNKTISWTVKRAGTTGAKITGGRLSTTGSGTAVITATVRNGRTATANYTKDFNIRVTYPIQKGKTYTVSGYRYKVTTVTNRKKEVTFVGMAAAKKRTTTTVNIGNTVKINNITMNVTAVGAKALKGNTKVRTVKLGNNVQSIGKEAFLRCTALRSVTIGTGLRTIGSHAFCNDTKLKTIIIRSASLKSVGRHSFDKVNATIKVPSSKVSAYKRLFNGKKGTLKISK